MAWLLIFPVLLLLSPIDCGKYSGGGGGGGGGIRSSYSGGRIGSIGGSYSGFRIRSGSYYSGGISSSYSGSSSLGLLGLGGLMFGSSYSPSYSSDYSSSYYSPSYDYSGYYGNNNNYQNYYYRTANAAGCTGYFVDYVNSVPRYYCNCGSYGVSQQYNGCTSSFYTKKA